MKPHLQVFKILTERLKPLGFTKRGTSWWQRQSDLVWQRIHIHKFTFTENFRVHAAIHVFGSEDRAPSLNGIHSHDGWHEKKFVGVPVKRYDFAFQDNPESIRKSANELGDYIEDFVIPWFEKWKDEQLLLTDNKSPLHEQQKEFLREAHLQRT
jgi:hypothetical protein